MLSVPEKISFRLPQSIHLDGFDIFIKEEIGSGGFGNVYLAEYEGIAYAIKLYRLWEVLPSEREDFVQRIFQEYKISETIASPYTVKILSYQEIGGNPLLIMEFCEGGSLRGVIGKSLEDQDILKIMEDICQGLAAMHEKGIIHRDIKPENILLKQQHYALTDFGISVSLHKRLTQTDIRGRVKQIFATAAYAPPEQADGTLAYKHLGPTNDIYALGVLLYELLTLGHLPFGSFEQYASDPLKYEEKKKLEDWDYTRLINTNVKAFWKNIIVKCLSAKAQDRFQHASQILELLKHSDFSTRNQPANSIVHKPLHWKLSIISKQQKNESFYISKLAQNKYKSKLTIGRLDKTDFAINDISLEENGEAGLSKFHATLEKYMNKNGGEQWYIRDGQWYRNHGKLDWYLSSNGVFVNDQQIGKYGIALHEGDRITLGNIQLVFQGA